MIAKAKTACENVEVDSLDHLADVLKMVPIGSGAERSIQDVMLTRHACYLIAQNGGPRKTPVAFAQRYFAPQTRKHETPNQSRRRISR